MSSTPEKTRKRIAVLGGGIAGLTAAYTLSRARQSGAPIEEILIEARDRLGGVIQTEKKEGFVIEAGPDSFLSEKPEAAALCRELGMGDALIGSNDDERRTYILHRGKLAPLPDGLMLLVPTRLWPMVSTPLLPFKSKIAMASEWMMPPSNNDADDESVADFVRRHFGSAMLDNIADPLLAGVYGGDSALLSARSVLNRFWKMEKKHGSLTRAVLQARRQRKADARKQGRAASKAPPLFTTLKGGLGQLTDKLIGELEPSRIQLGRRAMAIEASETKEGVCYRIRCEGGSGIDADGVLLAMPTHSCSSLVAGLDAGWAESLNAVPYNSAMTVALAYGPDTARLLPPGFGFLVPQKEKPRMLACTFVHAKFNHRAPKGHALLRCFLGGSRDPEALSLDDDSVVKLVRRELATVLKFSPEPLFYRVHRWPRSMAQYHVGHEVAVSHIQARLEEHQKLALAGNAYSGIGISDCVRTGRAAAEKLLKSVGG